MRRKFPRLIVPAALALGGLITAAPLIWMISASFMPAGEANTFPPPFFPFCASLALFLFLISVVTGGWLHPLNGWYCETLLSLTEHPPILFKSLYIERISPLFVVLYISALFFFVIPLQTKEEELIF